MTDLEVVADPGRRARWVADATADARFWDATPAWRVEAAREVAGDELVVWTDDALFGVDRIGAAMAPYLDGTVTVAELAEDLAVAAEVPVVQARSAVASLVVELAALGAVDGAVLPPVPEVEPTHTTIPPDRPEASERMILDPESGQEIRSVTTVEDDGRVMVTDHLPDGRKRVSTTMTFEAGRGEEGLAVAEALAGDRSVAELVPADSCLGFKLRNDAGVPLLSIRCADGRLRSVRCHDAEVADLLRARAGDALDTSGARGPVEAFVVTPLEGTGPLRIYDGHGRRRGRPRTPGEAVTVVDHVLGERTAAGPSTGDGPLLLGLVLLTGPGGRAVLAPIDALEGLGLLRRLAEAGWTVTWSRALLHPDARVTAPSMVGDPGTTALVTEVVVPGGSALSTAERVRVLVGTPVDGSDRPTALHRVLGLAEGARWLPLDGPLHVVLARLSADLGLAEASSSGQVQ